MSFNGFEVGKRSLRTHQLALGVTGHNISNANKDGYSRQLVEIGALTNRNDRYGALGIGAEVEEVNRVRNSFIDDRMMKEKSENSRWTAREINLKHMEYIINEPSDQGLRSSLDEYWKAMQEVSQNPEDMAIRVNLIERSSALVNSIKSSYGNFKALRKEFDDAIEVEVNTINTTLKRLASLNSQIRRIEINGGKANDLRDEFDNLTEELSEKLDLKVIRKDGEQMVAIGGRVAVQGDKYKLMGFERNKNVNGGMIKLVWPDINEKVQIKNGLIKGLIDLRDEDAVKYLKYLDQLAIGITDTTNDMNRAGFNIRGIRGGAYFDEFSTQPEILDLNNDNVDDIGIYRVRGNLSVYESDKPLGKMLTQVVENIETGEKREIPYNEVGIIELNGTRIKYDTSRDSMDDIIKRINKINLGVVASTDPDNRLILRAEKEEGYFFKSMEQIEGTLLNKLGILNGPGQFNFQNTGSVALLTQDRSGIPQDGAAERMAVAITNVEEIAAASGVDTTGDGIADTANPSGDGSNALRMAKLKDVKSIGRFTYEEYFKSVVSDLGVSSSEAKKYKENQDILIKNLEQRRQSEMGVSLDEEMSDMLKYQHGYDAAAKYIKTVDEMVETLITKL